MKYDEYIQYVYNYRFYLQKLTYIGDIQDKYISTWVYVRKNKTQKMDKLFGIFQGVAGIMSMFKLGQFQLFKTCVPFILRRLFPPWTKTGDKKVPPHRRTFVLEFGFPPEIYMYPKHLLRRYLHA